MAEAYYYRGLVNLRQGQSPQLPQAIEDFSQAIGLKSDLAIAYFQRGVSYYESRRFDDALKDLEIALELRERYASNKVRVDEAHCLYTRALCNYYLEEWEIAIKTIDEFLERAPSTHRGRPFALECRTKAQAKLEGE